MIFTAFLIVIFTVIGTNAAGPLYMWNAEQRIPYRWDVTSPVSIYTDGGPFEIIPASEGTPIPNEVADGIVAFAAKQWTDVETSSFQAQVVGDVASIGLPADITIDNVAQVVGVDNPGDGIHIIYDADGRITQDFFGAPMFSVLGIASPDFADEATGTITEGWVMINAQPRWAGDDKLENYAGVFTHEFGHSINLAHSQTNGSIAFYGDARGPVTCGSLPYDANSITLDDIETMYPYLNTRPGTGSGVQQSTVNVADDKASISNLYPAPGYPASNGSIKGRVLQTNGKDGITGVNVIARNLDNPFTDAVSAMSGDYVRVEAGDDGTFTLNGLTPGARYAVYTDGIVAGGFPTLQPFYIPGPEEFYNGANESGNGVTDDRCQSEAITAVAGTSTEADITLNSVKGAPKFSYLAPSTFPSSVTSDGTVIAGNVGQGPAFRYTEADGYEVLTEGIVTTTFMSRDGKAFAADTPSPNGNISSLLHYGGAWEQIPAGVPEPPATAQPCDSVSSSYGVASGGKAVAGMLWVDTNGPAAGQGCRVRPFIWTPEGGSQVLQVPANTRSSRPNNISDDGSTVMGWFDVTGFRQGIFWKNGTMVNLNTDPSFPVGEAYNSTPDGSIVIGANGGPNAEPWKWTSSEGIKTLGRVAPYSIATASAISDDGQIIAGLGGSTSFFPGDVSGRKAFLWTEGLGMVNFEDFLRSQGTYFEGWILNTTTAMSADGTTLVGVGFGPRAQGGWIVKMDKVNICHAPPGNPANAHTVNVDFPRGMQTHLNHGDTIGLCVDEPTE